MSLSDCEKCWETPCVCGHEYRLMPSKRRREIAEAVLKSLDGEDLAILEKLMLDLLLKEVK